MRMVTSEEVKAECGESGEAKESDPEEEDVEVEVDEDGYEAG